MQFNTCRLCKDTTTRRELFRYGIRHYCHAECGFARWGDDFLRKIPAHEIGSIPFGLFLDHPERRAIAIERCPVIAPSLKAMGKEKQ